MKPINSLFQASKSKNENEPQFTPVNSTENFQAMQADCKRVLIRLKGKLGFCGRTKLHKGRAQITSSIERYCYPRGTNLNNNSIGLVACPLILGKRMTLCSGLFTTVSSLISINFLINLQIVISISFILIFLSTFVVSYCYI